jgi:hypothetical protein
VGVEVVVYDETFNTAKTVNIFSKAKMVIGPHGAGLMNLMFSRPDYARVIEISAHTPTSSVGTGSHPCFFKSSFALGHSYVALRYRSPTVNVTDLVWHATQLWNFGKINLTG